MSDEKRKPCGEYHPFPCGVDRECGYLQLIDDLNDLSDQWEAASDDPQVETMSRHAYWNACKKLRGVLAEYDAFEEDSDDE